MQFESSTKLLRVLAAAAEGQDIDPDDVARLELDLPLWLREHAVVAWRRLMHYASDADIREHDPEYGRRQREAMKWHFDHLTKLLETDYR